MPVSGIRIIGEHLYYMVIGNKYPLLGIYTHRIVYNFKKRKMIIMKKFVLTTASIIFLMIIANAQVQLKGSKPGRAACTTPMGKLMLPVAIDTTKGRGVANNDLAWENGDVLLVRFMDNVGSQSLRNMITQAAKGWEQYANITLKFVPDNTPVTNLRIKLGGNADNLGHNSTVGLNSNDVSQNEQTMNLDTADFIDYDAYVTEFKNRGPIYQYLVSKGTDFKSFTYADLYKAVRAYPDPNTKWLTKWMRGTTMHEFGHALGLMHEQSYPGGIKWNVDTIYKYYQQYGWGKEKVDFNVLRVNDIFYTNNTQYDPLSIMHYAVEAWQTLDGYSVGTNYELSTGDKKLISAFYPKNQKVSSLAVPKIQVTNITAVDVKSDKVKKGILIYPSFDLKTSAVLGKLYFVARLTTEDGQNYIATTNEKYSWNQMAATYLKVNVLPSSKVSYNKGLKKNLELFFPFKEMPELAGKTVKVHFSVFVDDVVNKRLSKVAFNFLSSPLSVPK